MLDVMEQALAGGADIVQLRDKHCDKQELLRKAHALRALTSRYGATFIVNDHIDVALAAAADGVHLGQDDASLAEARQRLGAHKWIGISTHTIEQARRAEAGGADYIGVGPVFATATKQGAEPTGTDFIRQAAEHIRIPFVAIGGIKLHNAEQVLDTGARRLCAVSEIVGSDDVEAACGAFIRLIERYERQRSSGRTLVAIRVNGEYMQLEAQFVADVIGHFGLADKPVMAEVDGRIIGRGQWASTRLRDGMKLELLHAVGGG